MFYGRHLLAHNALCSPSCGLHYLVEAYLGQTLHDGGSSGAYLFYGGLPLAQTSLWIQTCNPQCSMEAYL